MDSPQHARYVIVIAAVALAALTAACAAPKAVHAAAAHSAAVSSAPPGAALIVQRIVTWNAGPGGRSLRELGRQLGVVARAEGSGDLAASARACARLGAVVADAQAAPPIPDATSQRFWAMALTEYETAAADCQTGASTGDISLVNQSTAHTTVGTNDLQEAINRLHALEQQTG